jgi:hypothetical protein
MSERLSSIPPQDDFDRSFIEDNDWLPDRVFPISKRPRGPASHADTVELQSWRTGDARPTTSQDGGGPAVAVEQVLSDASSDSPAPVPMRFKDDVFNPEREVK